MANNPILDAKRQTVRESWKLIHAWLKKNTPEFDPAPKKLGNAKQVRELSEILGRRVPVGFDESLRCLVCSNAVFPAPEWGMAYHSIDVEQILYDWEIVLRSCDVMSWNDHARVKTSPGVVQQWHAPYWIPFAANGAGDYFYLDLCPTYPGRVGQIIWGAHDDPKRILLANSYEEFIAEIAANYAAGNYHFENDSYGIQRRTTKVFPRRTFSAQPTLLKPKQ